MTTTTSPAPRRAPSARNGPRRPLSRHRPRLRLASAAALVSVLAAIPLRAEEFTIVGPRAMGMGGAGVAATRGSLSMHWNPAGLAPPRAPRVDSRFDLSLNGAATIVGTEDILVKVDDFLDSIEGFDDPLIQADLTDGGAIRDEFLERILRVAESIPPLVASGTGVHATMTPNLSFRWERLGFSASGFIVGGGFGNVDFETLALGFDGIVEAVGGNGAPSPSNQGVADRFESFLVGRGVDPADAQRVADELVARAESAGVDVQNPEFQDMVERIIDATESVRGAAGDVDDLFTQNETGVNIRGIALQEYGIGYAHPFGEWVSVGVAPKLLYGSTYLNPLAVFDDQNYEGVLDAFFNAPRQADSVNFGIDVGILVTPADWISVGLVGKNLNQPRFDFDGFQDSKYRIDPQGRGGIAVGPFWGLSAALDIDIFQNDSDALEGYESQIIGGGIEYAMFDHVFLRAGGSANLAEASEDPAIHLGLGARIFGFELDLAGMLSTDFQRVNGTDIPERGGLALGISIFRPLF